MKTIDADLLDTAVSGVNLRPGRGALAATLRDQLDPGPTLLAFLRHLG